MAAFAILALSGAGYALNDPAASEAHSFFQHSVPVATSAPDSADLLPGDPLDVIVAPGPDGLPPPSTLVSCGEDPQFEFNALSHLEPLTAESFPEFYGTFEDTIARFGSLMPGDRWSILTRSTTGVDLIRIDGNNASFLTFDATGTGWDFVNGSGAAPCRLRTALPEGLNVVEWTLDPDRPIDPGSTMVHVLATERACASGADMGDRLQGPQVVETDEDIQIAFAAIAQSANQHCPGNPAAPVTVNLESPIGNRTIRDGLVITTDLAGLLVETDPTEPHQHAT